MTDHLKDERAALAPDEQAKADRDLLLYGESFILDGKHIPVECIKVLRATQSESDAALAIVAAQPPAAEGATKGERFGAVELILRDACETDPADPDLNDTVCVSTATLQEIIERHIGTSNLLEWAVERWQAEVANRPLVNVHRRALDDTWRQVIRHCGGDADALLGPRHSDLLAAAPASSASEQQSAHGTLERHRIAGGYVPNMPTASERTAIEKLGREWGDEVEFAARQYDGVPLNVARGLAHAAISAARPEPLSDSERTAEDAGGDEAIYQTGWERPPNQWGDVPKDAYDDYESFGYTRRRIVYTRPASANKAVGLSIDPVREKLIELADELDGELDGGATWTKAQHTCCSVSGALRALAATQPAASVLLATTDLDAGDPSSVMRAGPAMNRSLDWLIARLTEIRTDCPDGSRAVFVTDPAVGRIDVSWALFDAPDRPANEDGFAPTEAEPYELILETTAGLHPDTASLVVRFAHAIALKLATAQAKYGYTNGWLRDGWMNICRAELMQHIEKGDPRDVAAYCAFLWHHGEPTMVAETPKTNASGAMRSQS